MQLSPRAFKLLSKEICARLRMWFSKGVWGLSDCGTALRLSQTQKPPPPSWVFQTPSCYITSLVPLKPPGWRHTFYGATNESLQQTSTGQYSRAAAKGREETRQWARQLSSANPAQTAKTRSVLFLPKCGVSKETQSIKTKYGDQRETGNFLWLVSTAYEWSCSYALDTFL